MQETAEELVYRPAVIDQVVIIQHHHKVFGNIIEDIVDRGRHQHIQVNAILAAGIKNSQGGPAALRKTHLNRGDKMGDKAQGIAIQFIDGIPAGRPLKLMNEIDQQ